MQHINILFCTGKLSVASSTFNIHRSKQRVKSRRIFWDLVQPRNGTLLSWFLPSVPCIAWQRWQIKQRKTARFAVKRCEPPVLLRQNVLIYLGIPLLLGIAMWAVGPQLSWLSHLLSATFLSFWAHCTAVDCGDDVRGDEQAAIGGSGRE